MSRGVVDSSEFCRAVSNGRSVVVRKIADRVDDQGGVRNTQGSGDDQAELGRVTGCVGGGSADELTDSDAGVERRAEGGVAAAIRVDVDTTEVGLSFPIV